MAHLIQIPGDRRWIQPAHVVSVRPINGEGWPTKIFFADGFNIEVQASADTIAELLNRHLDPR